MYTYFIYFVGWWFFTSGYKQGIYCIWGMVIFTVSTICTVKTGSAKPAVLAECESGRAKPPSLTTSH